MQDDQHQSLRGAQPCLRHGSVASSIAWCNGGSTTFCVLCGLEPTQSPRPLASSGVQICVRVEASLLAALWCSHLSYRIDSRGADTSSRAQNGIGAQQAGGPSNVYFTSQGDLITMNPGTAPAGASMSPGPCCTAPVGLAPYLMQGACK